MQQKDFFEPLFRLFVLWFYQFPSDSMEHQCQDIFKIFFQYLQIDQVLLFVACAIIFRNPSNIKNKNTYLNGYCEFEIEYFFVQNSLEISSFKIKYEF